MKFCNKIIRDKIPKILEDSGKDYYIHIVDDKEALKYLDLKLDEEVEEFHKDKNLEELADIMEVLFSLGKKLGYTEEDLLNKRIEKKEAKGGFDKNIILDTVY